ncbi:MAG: efflux RND transporter periplasmic adaptor subunit [Proteobacteria bacterium]|nr:MAG: efflux RND transporter periplasmic adaptor subunit [Pseudomonadota bacterium]
MSDRNRRTVVSLAIAVLLACGGDRSEPVRARAGDVEIAASVAPAASRVGPNELLVELRDAAGAPIEDAHVEVDVRMPPMGAMAAMGGAASVEPLGDGRYRAAYRLEMGGTWQVAIRVHRPSGAAAEASGSLTVGTPGLRLEGAGGTSPEAAHAEHDGSAAPAGAAAHERHPGEFRFDPARLRQIGVRSEPARREEQTASVRAVGRVTWDETALRDVTLRVGGFVGEVQADALGAPVEKGQVLFTLYSPEIFAAQREYLEALRASRAARGTSAPERGGSLAAAAERRLRLWGLESGDVAAIARRGAPQEYVPIRAPASGYVVEKEIVAGSAVAMGQRVYRIAPLGRVWIEAEVYEAELAHVAVGTPAEVTLPYLPGQRFEARVAYVYPSLQADRRTARVRLEMPNPAGALRPDMYATVTLRQPLGERLTVPDSAVLHAGDRSFVFLDLGEGRLRPQQVETGRTSDGRVEILGGLEAGQAVVVSGTFLVSGESRLRAALESW